MIVEWFVDFVLGLVRGLLDLLPEVGSGLGLPDLSPALDVIGSMNALLPMDALFAALAVLLSVEAGLFLFGLLRQVWRFVPFVGGG
jgi:hypothetical protein